MPGSGGQFLISAEKRKNCSCELVFVTGEPTKPLLSMLTIAYLSVL